MKQILVCLAVVLSMAGSGSAHQETAVPAQIDIVDRTGQSIPLELTFRNEQGSPVVLKQVVTKPTILVLVYFTCDRICPQMLGALATALGDVKMVPGKDYHVLSVSFDVRDTPAVAQKIKKNYMVATGMPFPDDAWLFLTGDSDAIEKLTGAAGFRFQAVGKEFVHPSVLIFLSPEGKITKYLPVETFRYGTQAPIRFSPMEVRNALADASQGKVWLGPRNPVLLCFPHMPGNQANFFTILAGAGIATLIGLAGYFIHLRKKERRS